MNPADYARICAESYDARPDRVFGLSVRMLIRTGDDGYPVLAFPGTRPDHLADDISDLDVGPLDTERGALAHRGFWLAAQLALPATVRYASLSARLDLIGHSLGAAIAINLGTMLAQCGFPPRRIVGFGCPRTAIGTWQRETLVSAGVEVLLYRNAGDPVPMVPVHIDAVTDIGRVLGRIIPSADDWRWGADVQQIGRATPFDLGQHAIANYCAALEASITA